MKLRTTILGLLLLVGQAMALDKVPAVMVSTSTNSYNVLTGRTAQADFDFIDDWLVAESNRLTSVSNLAQAAYNLAGTNGGSGAQRIYSYANTGTLSVASATVGQAYFYANTQSVGQLHTGMAVTGTTFSAGTTITGVDYASGKVDISLVCAAGAASASYWGSGTYTHIVPTNWTRCKIVVTGGGSSGAAAAASKPHAGAAGGTSVGYWSLRSGDSYTVTVGNGGTNVSGTVVGVAGGTSSFGSLQTATGGGAQPATDMDAMGGRGTGGQFNLTGGPGIAGAVGGTSFWGPGGGDGGTCATTNSFNYGAGGGAADQGTRSGAGHAGIVTVEYF